MISHYLAQNVATLRKARNLTQANLAKIAEVPRSTITHIESGDGNPSLKNLSKISAALKVGIEQLLAKPRSEVALIKAESIKMEERGFGARLYKLLPDPLPGMEIDRLEIEPGGKLGGLPHLEHTKEYLTCIQGNVKVHLTDKIMELSPGDVLAFPGHQPHAYQNSGDVKVICVSVVVLAH